MTAQTNLSIGTIGQKLESARQTKGVSVSEAGQATKILSKFIEAMENDDFGALSAPVYAKSFIKMYAQYLGLDAKPLVDEYLAQHAPNSKPKISEEVRQNLAAADHIAVDGNGGGATAAAPEPGKAIFGGVNDALSGLSGLRLSPRTLMIAAGALLVIILFAVGVSQCANDEDDAPAAAALSEVRAEREALAEGVPDVYLVKPGEIKVER